MFTISNAWKRGSSSSSSANWPQRQHWTLDSWSGDMDGVISCDVLNKIEMDWRVLVESTQTTTSKATSKSTIYDEYTDDWLYISCGRWREFLELVTPVYMGYKESQGLKNHQEWWPNVVRNQQKPWKDYSGLDIWEHKSQRRWHAHWRRVRVDG